MVGSSHVPAGSYTIFDSEQGQVVTHHQQKDGRMGTAYRPVGRSARIDMKVSRCFGRRELHHRLRQTAGGCTLRMIGRRHGIRGNYEDVALFGKVFSCQF